MMAKSKTKQSVEDWNYEVTVARVEEILDAIEGGDLDLAEVFDRFAVGVDYLQQCDRFLTTQQERVELLLETLGEPDRFPDWEISQVSPRPPIN
jgi:exodeoxyribonuclease VII small subunit